MKWCDVQIFWDFKVSQPWLNEILVLAVNDSPKKSRRGQSSGCATAPGFVCLWHHKDQSSWCGSQNQALPHTPTFPAMAHFHISIPPTLPTIIKSPNPKGRLWRIRMSPQWSPVQSSSLNASAGSWEWFWGWRYQGLTSPCITHRLFLSPKLPKPQAQVSSLDFHSMRPLGSPEISWSLHALCDRTGSNLVTLMWHRWHCHIKPGNITLHWSTALQIQSPGAEMMLCGEFPAGAASSIPVQQTTGETSRDRFRMFCPQSQNKYILFSAEDGGLSLQPRETLNSAVVIPLQYSSAVPHLLIQWEGSINLTRERGERHPALRAS